MNTTNAKQAPDTERHTEEEAIWRQRARHYTPAFQDAFVHYMTTGDRSCLVPLSIGLLEHHIEDLTPEWLAKHAASLNLHNDLGADSMLLAEIAFAVEELFDVTMNNQELGKLVHLNDLADLIEQKRVVN
ncbi:acyl carrier protein [Cerasicoccus frondis]|uniref:acyl carrier protein n=1 Tax=Cerasicoccus frondis TaxID=490090 RepID=UPI002852AF3F|nr:acyl carrier protein [Cerasicoccus frondis]